MFFVYDVQVGDVAPNGIAIDANKLTAGDDGSIRGEGAGGVDADLSHEAVPADPNHKVSAPGGL